MKLEDYKAWLLEHGEIKEEYERPYNPQCDPPEYKDGSYFLSYDLMYAGRPYAGFAVGDVTLWLAISMFTTSPKLIWR